MAMLGAGWGPLLPALLALALLPGGALGGNCGTPPRLIFAELQEEFQGRANFSVGDTVRYSCRPGYMRNPGTLNSLTCENDFSWSPVIEFCKGKSCGHPGQLAHGSVHITDLTLGSEITFSCEEGYRIVGDESSRCVIDDQKVMWDREFPLCQAIPCLPPPEISNGRHSGEPSAQYTYGSSVTYSCNPVKDGARPFSLIGEAAIHCTSDPEKNGVWSGAPPECKVVKCRNEELENGRKISGFGPSYTYKDSIVFECSRGYELIGSSSVTCQANDSWAPPIPTCRKATTPAATTTPLAPTPSTCKKPVFSNGDMYPSKPQYVVGEAVNLTCRTNYAFSDNAASRTVVCRGGNMWRPSVEACHPSKRPDLGELPIKNGKIVSGGKDKYSIGDIVVVECASGYTMHGVPEIKYIGKNKWEPEIPECKSSPGTDDKAIGYGVRAALAVLAVLAALVVVAVLLWCCWKKHRSQEGSYRTKENGKEAYNLNNLEDEGEASALKS